MPNTLNAHRLLLLGGLGEADTGQSALMRAYWRGRTSASDVLVAIRAKRPGWTGEIDPPPAGLDGRRPRGGPAPKAKCIARERGINSVPTFIKVADSHVVSGAQPAAIVAKRHRRADRENDRPHLFSGLIALAAMARRDADFNPRHVVIISSYPAQYRAPSDRS